MKMKKHGFGYNVVDGKEVVGYVENHRGYWKAVAGNKHNGLVIGSLYNTRKEAMEDLKNHLEEVKN